MKLDSDSLKLLAEGDASVADSIIPTLYDDLRCMAARMLSRERAGHTLQPTTLVHEAYLRFVDSETLEWRGKARFMSLAGEVLRKVLVDHARTKYAAKRGGGFRQITLDDQFAIAADGAIDLIALEDALQQLEGTHPELARIIELRYFAGMDGKTTAAMLEISADTLRKRWRLARALLIQLLEGQAPPDGE
jgi:RNA polymerase sigma-70 factor (ECF subfamily)